MKIVLCSDADWLLSEEAFLLYASCMYHPTSDQEGIGERMASSKEYLDFILEQLSELDEITYRAMMGEYIIYYRGKVIGGIYDDRFLVKNIKAAADLMPEAELELPYDGAKEMLMVDDVENKEFLRDLLEAMYNALPTPRKKKQL